MNFKRSIGATILAGGVGLAAVLGLGLGSAAAQPGGCGAPNTPACGPNQPGGPNQVGPSQPGPNWQARGINQGRQDHQPFNWNGQQVTPMPAGNGAGWGFWFLGQWIPL